MPDEDFVDSKETDGVPIVLLVPIDARVVRVIALLVFSVSWLLFDRLFGE